MADYILCCPFRAHFLSLRLIPQGVAVGLTYVAPSGRSALMLSIMLRPERAKFNSPEQRSGLIVTKILGALKGQYYLD